MTITPTRMALCNGVHLMFNIIQFIFLIVLLWTDSKDNNECVLTKDRAAQILSRNKSQCGFQYTMSEIPSIVNEFTTEKQP